MRIVAGRWRGRPLVAPAGAATRPTADRVREALFSMLASRLGSFEGLAVLDVFAGTGALGLEALSRGAADAVLIERDAMLAASLRATLARLDGGQRGRVVQGDALAWLAGDAGTFDIAFVDPPFAAGLWPRGWPALAPRLAPGALVHVEGPADVDPCVPDGWALHREGRTREVRHALYRVPAASVAAATLDSVPAAGEPSSRCETP